MTSYKPDEAELKETVRRSLVQTGPPSRSPALRNALIRRTHNRPVSARTINTWIKRDPHREHWKSYLLSRDKRLCRRKNPTRCGAAHTLNVPGSLNAASAYATSRRHRSGTAGNGGIVTLECRRSRFTIITKIQSQDADHVQERIKQRLKQFAEEQRRSITFHNGTEFARCQRLKKQVGLQRYLADPGCRDERGTNENTNGLIRQYFPNGTDFCTVSHPEVGEVENLLNNRPRTCLQFETPAAVFHRQTSPVHCD